MRSFSLAFLVGVCFLQYFTELPRFTVPLLLLITTLLLVILQFLQTRGFIKPILLIKIKLFRKPLINLQDVQSTISSRMSFAHWKRCVFLLFAILLGFDWSLWQAHWILDLPLPNTSVNQNSIKAIGTISSIPEQKNHAWRFTFAATQLADLHYSTLHPLNLRITWYGQPSEHLRVGDLWEFQLKIKASHSFANPGSFDYGKWLFENHLRSTATVQSIGNNLLLRTQRWHQFIDRFRQLLNEHINNDLAGLPVAGMISALSVGIRDQITPAQWQILRNTGTNHLMAIAGLHIGFISGMTYFLINFLWRRIALLTMIIPAQQCAAFAALCSAFSYSALAGFALPTQRAVIMLSIFLIATLLRRHLIGWQAWCLALLSVLVWDPLATLSASFWLSFGTVALIIYGTSARLNVQSLWWRWGRTQWVISIGLMPFSLLFFQQISLISFIANSIAIPWVGFIVLPLSFIGSLLLFICPILGKCLLVIAEHLLNYLWFILQTLAAQPMMQWYQSIDNEFIFGMLLVGIILLLAPSGWPARWLGLCWSLPILFWQPAAPAVGQFTLNFLDAGANSIAVVRTSEHTLLYETHAGPQKYVDINNAVIVPYLRTQGISKIDTVISDTRVNNDAFTAVSINHVNTPAVNSNNISATMTWTWNGVQFQYSPPQSRQNKTGILKIACNQNTTVLNDKNSIIASGGKNDYVVTSSYTTKSNSLSVTNAKSSSRSDSILYSTYNCGAIGFVIGSTNRVNPPSCYRKLNQYFWVN